MALNFSIEGELVDLNTYIKALNSNRYSGNSIKQSETERVYYEIIQQKIKPVKDYPVHIEFHWYSKDKKKDIDNVAFSKKFINDGMVMANLLENDSRKYISGFSDKFYIDKDNPRIEVIITPSNSMH